MRSEFFEWDDDKAEANLAKHGVSFELAAEVFSDPLCVTFHDRLNSIGEEHEITIGTTFFIACSTSVIHCAASEYGSFMRAMRPAQNEKSS